MCSCYEIFNFIKKWIFANNFFYFSSLSSPSSCLTSFSTISFILLVLLHPSSFSTHLFFSFFCVHSFYYFFLSLLLRSWFLCFKGVVLWLCCCVPFLHGFYNASYNVVVNVLNFFLLCFHVCCKLQCFSLMQPCFEVSLPSVWQWSTKVKYIRRMVGIKQDNERAR